jgi:Arc/MetJ family transcription regulator
MRTTLDLPEDLLSEAMKAAGLQTKTAVIIEALKELIRKQTISGIKAFKGKVSLEIDFDTLRSRR